MDYEYRSWLESQLGWLLCIHKSECGLLAHTLICEYIKASHIASTTLTHILVPNNST